LGHAEGPIRIRELGDVAPKIPAAQSVRNQNILSSKADLEILSSFLREEMNTKVEDNFVAHNLDAEFKLCGVLYVGDMALARKDCESGKSG
jgi:hypothetical protein